MAVSRTPSDYHPVDTADLRNRPVVLESAGAREVSRRHRLLRPRTVLGGTAIALLTAGGVIAGSWSIWATVHTTTPTGPPAPLWFSPPAPVAPTAAEEPSTVDNPAGAAVFPGIPGGPATPAATHTQPAAPPPQPTHATPAPTTTIGDDHRGPRTGEGSGSPGPGGGGHSGAG